MATLIVLTVFAAYGLLWTLWALFGFLLPGGRGAAAVFLCCGEAAEDAVLRRYLWLYHSGLVRSPLFVIDCGLSPKVRKRLERYPIIVCTAEELHDKLEQERAHLGRTGT